MAPRLVAQLPDIMCGRQKLVALGQASTIADYLLGSINNSDWWGRHEIVRYGSVAVADGGYFPSCGVSPSTCIS